MDIVLEELTAGLLDSTAMVRVIVRLVTAMLLGALVGVEREFAGKAAGLRTHVLVSMGSALFVMIPALAGSGLDELSRVIQGVAAGIGFIGAGAILKRDEEGDVQGLTTAAGIWLTAVVGIAVGAGHIGKAIVSVVLALIVFTLFSRVTAATGNHQQVEVGKEDLE